MKRIGVVVGLVLLAGACARAPQSQSGVMLAPTGGDVQIQRDGEWRSATESTPLERGDRVKVGRVGGAVVQLPGGTLELRAGSVIRIASMPELEMGSLLARAASPLSVGVGTVQVRAEEGDFRLDRSLSLRVGVYRGEVSIPGSAWDGTVPALREVGVAGGTVPRGPVALSVDPGDPWDDRYLGRAIEVGERLDRLQDGVALQLPPRADRDVVTPVLPLDARTVLRGIPARASADQLSEAVVASFVAEAAAPARGVGPERAFGQVMELRAIGASWTVVAAEWQLARSGLASLLEITTFLSDLTAPGASTVGQAGPGETGGAGSSSTGGSGSEGTGGGTDGGDGGGSPEPPPPPGCDGLVDCTVEQVLEVPGGTGEDLLP